MRRILLVPVLVFCSVLFVQCGSGSGGAKSPEALFTTLKTLDRNDQSAFVACVAPDDRCLLSFAGDFSASLMTAFAKDKAVKDQYAAVRTKYNLPDQSKNKIDITKLDAAIAYARDAYKHVDHAAFLKDMAGVLSKVTGMKTTVKSPYKELKDLKVSGNTATGKAVLADGKTEDLSFVQVDGNWYLSIKNSFIK